MRLLVVDVSIERHQPIPVSLQRRTRPGWTRRQVTASAGGGQKMVFRKDRGGESFQRQISALRQQLGSGDAEEIDETMMSEASGSPEADYVAARRYEPPTQYERERYVYEPGATEIVETTPSNEPPVPVIPSVDGQTTVLSPNATWKGEIVAEGSMHILGKFEGDLKIRDDLFILDDARVDGSIAAGTVVISGHYDGKMNCNQRLEVLPTGHVRGEIFAPTLVVHDGAVINSKIRMTGSADSEQPVPAVVHRRGHRGTA